MSTVAEALLSVAGCIIALLLWGRVGLLGPELSRTTGGGDLGHWLAWSALFLAATAILVMWLDWAMGRVGGLL